MKFMEDGKFYEDGAVHRIERLPVTDNRQPFIDYIIFLRFHTLITFSILTSF